ncbi:MAG: glutamate-5-semialdehyde dehydrogenase [Candidatus Latescibacteria bacterium]|nr:glutamate-5-semialdehyde dehydrogenase [Candidatus Latescibacterota bacterium]
MDIYDHVIEKAKKAKKAAAKMPGLPSAVKDKALLSMAEVIINQKAKIQDANQKDLEAAKKSGLSNAMIDRLTLTDVRIGSMANGLREVASFPDPVGRLTDMVQRPSGIRVGKMTVPIGLIGFIYESRPNVTADAAGLCLKAGNAILLRGGKEALNSNCVLAELLNQAAVSAGVPDGAISLIEKTDHDGVKHMIEAAGIIDLLIPRGGKGLIKAVVDGAKIPVIKHFEGNCHVYIDKYADIENAISITVNAKTQRPGVCNAAETLLVHNDIAGDFLPRAAGELQAKGVELRGCDRSREIVTDMKVATDDDWYTEYLDLILAVRIVDSLEQAVEHINTYSSSHTEAIVTSDITSAEYFVTNVDSSSVIVNASTRFSDGGEYGLGAEIGISTDKLHARGPMGVADLTTYKWVVYGNGTIRQ